MRSPLEPIKKIARMIRVHKPLILNWFGTRDEVSLGAVEGLNSNMIESKYQDILMDFAPHY